MICSEESFRDGSVLEVVDDVLETVSEFRSTLVLEEVWDHAVRVKLDDLLDVITTFKRLPGHVGQSVVGNHITINLVSMSLAKSFVALG